MNGLWNEMMRTVMILDHAARNKNYYGSPIAVMHDYLDGGFNLYLSLQYLHVTYLPYRRGVWTG